MSLLSIILPPLIGGIIGSVTNDLAIKMLFRPYKAVYIGKFRLPFTPGIVPKRLEELAVLLGREVEAQFFNADDLELLFRSDAFADAVAGSLTDMIYTQRTTLCFTLESLEMDDTTADAMNRVREGLTDSVASALRDTDFAPAIASVMLGMSDRLPKSLGSRSAVNTLAPTLADGIRDFLSQEKGRRLVASLIDDAVTELGDRPLRDIAGTVFGERDALFSLIKELYLRFMASYVRPVVESIDVAGMITAKLRLMEPRAIEKLITSIVSRELRYIVLLGGLLGLVIGAVNIFI